MFFFLVASTFHGADCTQWRARSKLSIRTPQVTLIGFCSHNTIAHRTWCVERRCQLVDLQLETTIHLEFSTIFIFFTPYYVEFDDDSKLKQAKDKKTEAH